MISHPGNTVAVKLLGDFHPENPRKLATGWELGSTPLLGITTTPPEFLDRDG